MNVYRVYFDATQKNFYMFMLQNDLGKWFPLQYYGHTLSEYFFFLLGAAFSLFWSCSFLPFPLRVTGTVSSVQLLQRLTVGTFSLNAGGSWLALDPALI